MTEQTITHQPMTLYVGPINCNEMECEQYFTDDGHETGILSCSHLTLELACATCSTEQPETGFYETTVPWPCPPATEEPTR